MSNVDATENDSENGPWGPHRDAIADRVASCTDFLGRVQRSLSGEAAPDRHYFSMRARDLHHAARDLVRLTEEVEGWLIVCGEPLFIDYEACPLDATCELPRNHYGDHDDEPLPSLAVQARDTARILIDSADEFASWVNHLGLRSDQRRAFGIEKVFDPEFHEVFDGLEQMTRSIFFTAKEVGEITEKLIYEMPQEEWDELGRYDGDDEEDDLDGDTPDEPASPAIPKPRRARGLDL